MTWGGRPLGGLNVFSECPHPLAPSSRVLARNFADVATLALTQPSRLSEDDLAERVSAALEGRVVVEQAKGVVAQIHGLDMDAAYNHLVDKALETRSTLSQTAREVIRGAHQR